MEPPVHRIGNGFLCLQLLPPRTPRNTEGTAWCCLGFVAPLGCVMGFRHPALPGQDRDRKCSLEGFPGAGVVCPAAGMRHVMVTTGSCARAGLRASRVGARP